jgi:choline-sulfatase
MSRQRISINLAAVCLVLLSVLTLYENFRPRPLNVIVLTVDSWRADSATPELMPQLFEAARSGVVFEKHRAISGWTGPNVVAVLTGLSSFEQGLHARGNSLPADLDLPTKRARQLGWQVTGLQAFMLIDLFKNLGIEFDPGAELKSWIEDRNRDRQKFFLWYHYLQTHLPYDSPGKSDADNVTPPDDPELSRRQDSVRTLPAIAANAVVFRPSDREWVRSAYMRGVRDFDTWFGEFWEFFETSGLRESTVLVVTADHGEELLERGLVGHASTTRAGHLHEEIVRIPLFVWAPPGRLPVPPGSRISSPTDHLMIAPTIVDIVGLEAPSNSGKPRLWDSDRNYLWSALTSIAGFSEPEPDDVKRFVAAASDGRLKVQMQIDQGKVTKVEKWNLNEDPNEERSGQATTGNFEPLIRRIEDQIATMRLASNPQAPSRSDVRDGIPGWVHPEQSGEIGFDDIAGAAYLSWTGNAAARHVLEYESGTGLLALSGQIEVDGTRYDFGAVDQGYWNTWVLPYGRVRFRVRPASSLESWSEWLELEFAR